MSYEHRRRREETNEVDESRGYSTRVSTRAEDERPRYTAPLFPRRGEQQRSPDRRSIRTSSSRSSGSLSPTCKRFVEEVALEDFRGARDFLYRNPGVIDEGRSTQAFLTEATNELQRGREEEAENLVEKAIILYRCCKERDPSDYLRTLVRRNGGDIAAEKSKVLGICRKRVKERGQAPAPESMQSQMARMTIRGEPLQQQAQQRSRHFPSAEPDQGASTSFQHGSWEQGRRSEQRDPHREGVDTSGRHFANVTFASDVRDRPDRVSGTAERSYQTGPRTANRALQVGQIFAKIDVEPRKSALRPRRGTSESSASSEEDAVTARARRFAVVNVTPTGCWAVSIDDYGGRGLLRSGLRSDERAAHAIVHMIWDEALALPGEGRLLSLRPIAIEPLDHQSKLPRASRINFSKVHSFENNIDRKVVGKVTEESMPRFERYFERWFPGHADRYG